MKKFAIVRWCEVPDKGQLSIVETSDISGYSQEIEFSIEDYLANIETCIDIDRLKTDYIFLVRWKSGRKPESGWCQYEAEVLSVSDSRSTLEKMLRDGSEDSSESMLGKRDRKVKTIVDLPRELTKDGDVQPSKKKAKHHAESKTVSLQKNMLEKFKSSMDSTKNHFCQSCQKYKAENAKLKEEVLQLKNTCAKVLPEVLQKIEEIVKRIPVERSSVKSQEVPLARSTGNAPKRFWQEISYDGPELSLPEFSETRIIPETQDIANPVEDSVQPFQPTATSTQAIIKKPLQSIENSADTNEKVEIFLGSGVKVSPASWADAMNQKTGSGMTTVLLRAIFPDDVLLKSNLCGGINKTNKEGPKNSALDPVKKAAIFSAVQKKFPDFARRNFSSCILNKISYLRLKYTKQNKAQ